MATEPDARTISLVDIPLVWRLSENGTVLDSEVGLTRDARGPNSALLSSILFPRGVYTLVARADHQRVVGQFRYRPDDTVAHIVYIAPPLVDDAEDTIWLRILDAMSREAGKHGATALVAEVETSSYLFETLRTARFATYARQTIWRHNPVTSVETDDSIELTEETSGDQMGIMALICSTVPTMLHQVAAPHSDMQGVVCRKEGRIEAYVAISEGKHGVYLIPHIHPDVMDQADVILKAAIARTAQAQKVPIYVSVRSYQSWLDNVMQQLGFEAWIEQAVMVKHIAAGVRYASFNRIKVQGKLEVANHIMPPSWSSNRTDDLPVVCIAPQATPQHLQSQDTSSTQRNHNKD